MNNTTQPTGTIQAGQSTYLNDINKGLPIGTSSSFSQMGAVPVNQVVDASKISAVNPIKVPETGVDTSLSNLNAYLGSTITPPSGTTVDATSGTAQLPPQAQQTGGNTAIMSKLTGLYDKLTGKSDFTSNLENQFQVNEKQQASVDTFNQYNQRRLQLAKQEQDFLNTNTGQSEQSKNFQYNELRRNNAYELANQAIAVQAAQGNYTAALDTIKRKTDAIYAPLQDQIDNLTKFYQLNQNDLTESEKMTLQTKIDAQKAQKKVLSDAYENTLKTLAENSAPADIYSTVDKASKDPNATASSIIASAGKYASNILDKQYKQAQINKLNREASITGGETPTQYKNDLDAITGTVLSTIPSKFGQQTFTTQIKRARNDADKLNVVAAQILKGQPSEFKKDFANQTVGIAQIDKAIKEIDNGVKTGYINDKLQYTFNTFGKDYDPKLAKIQNYITSAIQPYRNSVTGAAWGEQEDNEYAQLFGSTKYSPTELKQRLEQTKELLKSKSVEGLNAFANPLGTMPNQFNVGTFSIGGKTIKAPDGQEIIITD